MKRILIVAAVLFLAGCAARSQSPVLYPNGHLKRVGEVQAQRDIEDCSRLAEAYVKANPGAKVVGGAIVGGLLLGVLEMFGAGLISSGFKDAVALIILIVVLLIRPEGILGVVSGRKV
jgi:hypothetical protein